MNLEAPKGIILNRPMIDKVQSCRSSSLPLALNRRTEAVLLQVLLAACGFLSILGITVFLSKPQLTPPALSLSSLGVRVKKTVNTLYKVDTDYLTASAAILKQVSESVGMSDKPSPRQQRPQMLASRKPVYSSSLLNVSLQPRSASSLARLGADRYETNLVQRKLVQIIRNRGRKGVDPVGLAQKIILESRRANFDPLFVAAVIKSESAFDRLAVSSAGARGLMQILPSTGTFIAGLEGFETIMKRHLTDPDYNVRLGIAYLQYLEQMYKGNRMLVLTAYNWGPGRVQDAVEGRRNIPAEVMTYALRILKDHQEWVNEIMVAA